MSWPGCYVRSRGAGELSSSWLIHSRYQWHLPLRARLITKNDGSGDRSHCSKWYSLDWTRREPTSAELSCTHSALDANGSCKTLELRVCNAIDFCCYFFARESITCENFYNSFFSFSFFCKKLNKHTHRRFSSLRWSWKQVLEEQNKSQPHRDRPVLREYKSEIVCGVQRREHVRVWRMYLGEEKEESELP